MARWLFAESGQPLAFFDDDSKYLYAADSNDCIAFRDKDWMYKMNGSPWGFISNNFLWEHPAGNKTIGFFDPRLDV